MSLQGKTIELPGVKFPKQTKSLVIAISAECHFCKESLPFYRSLSDRMAGKLDIVAVLPQPQQVAQSFIHDANVRATQIVSTDLNSIGVSGTPTLLLVDRFGKVERTWIGKLDETRQQEVSAAVVQ